MSWTIDLSHSEINFKVRHMMISNVRGQFERFSGSVNFNEANPALTTVDIQIETASINTNEEKRDAHLRSADFFDAENHPLMTFKSKRGELVDETNARLIGDLTIRGASREIALNVEYLGKAKSPWGTTSAGFTAAARINRKDWDLTWNVALETGGWLVGEAIDIEIALELVEVTEPVVEAVA
ncbi:MAG: YceI family protein [Anaerolineales bacterium]|jgi:polyisoprenoid-binding protein YceI|nr:YceI family protein [Anaerolineales bacterium]